MLDSAIHFPSFLEQLQSRPTEPRVRTVNAVFKHVGLSAQDIKDLGTGQAELALIKNQPVTDQMISEDQQKKDARAIKLNSASLDITDRFTAWYGQRRHTIEYQADGDYFRIWIADDRRPGVKIELEARSKGFQWFFSFYLIFLVESDEGHKDAILLLDEPGLHLHPTAQQELIAFFEKLSEKNQLLYTTHSPFLVDGDNIHRVRPVTEDESGHSHVSTEGWPKDRETIFPLQAAAGYAMVRGLFQHKQNILVEGMSDFTTCMLCPNNAGPTRENAFQTPSILRLAGAPKWSVRIAALFLGKRFAIWSLDGDEAGRVRRDALFERALFSSRVRNFELDEALVKWSEVEIEDSIGEQIY